MSPAKWFKEMMDSARRTFTFRLETMILEITEQVVNAMEEKGISRTNLAELLNVSPAAVTKVLNGTSNFTLKTLLSLADALGLELHVSFKAKKLTAAKTVVPDFNKATLDSATTALNILPPKTFSNAIQSARTDVSSGEDIQVGVPNKWEYQKAA